MLRSVWLAVTGTYCHAVDPDGNDSCWTRVPKTQPGLICDPCWELLARDGSVEQRCAIAREPHLPPRVADILLQDHEEMVRSELATGAITARQRLALAGDTDRVTMYLARRDDLTDEDLAVIRQSDNAYTKKTLALD